MRVKSSRELSRIAKHEAVATGIAEFQRLVEAGYLPSNHPHDGAYSVIRAIKEAGFTITKAPTKGRRAT
jgi:hypothetical protein|tara:strand:+ start:302 stop:508 length:207 start_codon:yes stop_codon:yes gene_type:complete